MSLARKVILHAPLSDEALLETFVEQCLADRVSLLAIIGAGSAELEERVDWIVVGDGSTPDRFLCTTSHSDESLTEVLDMLAACEANEGGSVEQVYL